MLRAAIRALHAGARLRACKRSACGAATRRASAWALAGILEGVVVACGNVVFSPAVVTVWRGEEFGVFADESDIEDDDMADDEDDEDDER